MCIALPYIFPEYPGFGFGGFFILGNKRRKREKRTEFFHCMKYMHRNTASLVIVQSKMVFPTLNFRRLLRQQQIASDWFYCHKIN